MYANVLFVDLKFYALNVALTDGRQGISGVRLAELRNRFAAVMHIALHGKENVMNLRKDEWELIEIFMSLNADDRKRLLEYAEYCSIKHPKNLIENKTLTQKRARKAKLKPRKR